MPAFVPAQIFEEALHLRVFRALCDFCIKNAARELGRKRADQKIGELSAKRQVERLKHIVECFCATEMAFVRVRLEIGHQPIPFCAHR